MSSSPITVMNNEPPHYETTQRFQGNSAINKEIKLYNNTKEREMYENMADLYSIIKTVEHLERAFIRDSISSADYNPACSKLIAQFKTAKSLNVVPDLQQFVNEYRLDCKTAVDRLTNGPSKENLHSGAKPLPAPLPAKLVAETVQNYITAMDSVKLNLVSVDAIHPLLIDLSDCLNRIHSLPPDYEGKAKIQNWLAVLNKMRASEELNEEQVRQLLFDLESSYNAFHGLLLHS